MPPKNGRFVSNAAQEHYRRYQREYQRNKERGPDKRQRTGSRHKRYPRCGNRCERCACDSKSPVPAALVASAWQQFESSVEQGRLLTLLDTQDCGATLREMQNWDVSDGSDLFALCAMNRYFSRPATWEALRLSGGVCVTIPKRKCENWSPVHLQKCQVTLKRLWGSASPVFGSGRRALPLRAHQGKRLPAGTADQKAHRDSLALHLFWAHRPPAASGLVRQPSPSKFSALLQQWEKLNSGPSPVFEGFSGYFTKCVLDVFVPAAKLPDVIVANNWPVKNCEGYLQAMQLVVPGMARDESSVREFLHYVHRKLSPKHGLSYPESLAQLCWFHRRTAGSLDDGNSDRPPSGWRLGRSKRQEELSVQPKKQVVVSQSSPRKKSCQSDRHVEYE